MTAQQVTELYSWSRCFAWNVNFNSKTWFTISKIQKGRFVVSCTPSPAPVLMCLQTLRSESYRERAEAVRPWLQWTVTNGPVGLTRQRPGKLITPRSAATLRTLTYGHFLSLNTTQPHVQTHTTAKHLGGSSEFQPVLSHSKMSPVIRGRSMGTTYWSRQHYSNTSWPAGGSPALLKNQLSYPGS